MEWIIVILVIGYICYREKERDDAIIDAQCRREDDYYANLYFNKPYNRLTDQEKEKLKEYRYGY